MSVAQIVVEFGRPPLTPARHGMLRAAEMTVCADNVGAEAAKRNSSRQNRVDARLISSTHIRRAGRRREPASRVFRDLLEGEPCRTIVLPGQTVQGLRRAENSANQ